MGDTDAGARDVRAPAGQSADRGLRGAGGRVKFGVVRFPGSCDEVDALLGLPPLRRRRAALARRPRPEGVDAVVVPGGFSYGDYLRAGAIARFSPVMEAVSEFALEGGPVLGHLQRLPGAVRGRPAARRAAAQRRPAVRRAARSSSRWSTPPRRSPAICERRRPALDPGQAHDRPLLRARGGSRRAGCTRADHPSLRRGPQPQRLGARHRRGVQPRQERDGPDAAPRARGGPAHRLGRRRLPVRVARRARGRARRAA